jgi:hypothetical protein
MQHGRKTKQSRWQCRRHATGAKRQLRAEDRIKVTQLTAAELAPLARAYLLAHKQAEASLIVQNLRVAHGRRRVDPQHQQASAVPMNTVKDLALITDYRLTQTVGVDVCADHRSPPSTLEERSTQGRGARCGL